MVNYGLYTDKKILIIWSFTDCYHVTNLFACLFVCFNTFSFGFQIVYKKVFLGLKNNSWYLGERPMGSVSFSPTQILFKSINKNFAKFIRKKLTWSLFSNVGGFPVLNLGNILLPLSWQRSLTYRNQITVFKCKSMDWFLHDRDLRHEIIKSLNVVTTVL